MRTAAGAVDLGYVGIRLGRHKGNLLFLGFKLRLALLFSIVDSQFLEQRVAPVVTRTVSTA